jgi:hypothetical protein
MCGIKPINDVNNSEFVLPLSSGNSQGKLEYVRNELCGISISPIHHGIRPDISKTVTF